MRTTYRITFEEKNGSYNQKLVEADTCSKAVAYVEADERCKEIVQVERCYDLTK